MDARVKLVEPGWQLRIWVLAAAGATLGLVIQQLVDLPESDWIWGPRLVAGAVLFLGISGLGFALVWQRERTLPAIVLGLVCGLVSGGVLIWNGLPGGGEFFSWQLFCGLVGSGFILTLFQAAQSRHPYFPGQWTPAGLRHWKREALDYADVHESIWTNALILGATGLFVGIVMLVAHLLAEMFMLVEIDLLREILRKNWANAILIGGAAGAAIGLLRDRAPIITALQRVGMTVLRVLAPVLAVGLVAFIAVLPFTGLAPLWATGNTTPIMLGASILALFLVNAVVGDRVDEAALARPLRWGAIALGLVMLPLVLIAAWSTGLRIGQHGLSPDRLWALTFIILGTITAIAYAVAILKRGDWITRLYRSNLHLAFILGGVAILLSTPLLGFDRIATTDQLARLEREEVSAEEFDYRGLWFDFGPPGKAAIERLAKDGKDAKIRGFAAATKKLDSRWREAPNEVAVRTGEQLDRRLTILPEKVALEKGLRERLADFNVCGLEEDCLMRFVSGRDVAVAVRLPLTSCNGCAPQVTLLYRSGDDWFEALDDGAARRLHGNLIAPDKTGTAEDAAAQMQARAKRWLEGIRAGDVELRDVTMRRLFIAGEPFGDPIPLENAAEP